MALLEPAEYDASYFDGGSQQTQHNAGFTKYRRWEVNGGEFWVDKAAGWINHLAISGKKVLELASAKGFIVEDFRNSDVDAWGRDISQYAYDQADPAIQPFLTVGDATDLSEYSNKEFDVIISFRLLECISDLDIIVVLNQCKAKGKKQVHIVSTNVNATYYQERTLQQWMDDFNWPQGTVLAPYNDEENYITK